MALSATAAHAGQPGLPTNGTVTVGSATIAQPNANQLNITTGTSRTVIDWDSFSIAAGNKVAIQQPGSSSITVNEIVGQDPSKIFGDLSSNGRVVLANPNGIWFGPDSHVDVAGLVASTATLSADAKKAFASGGSLSLDVAGKSTASIVNDGRISIAGEGLGALVAPGVRNNGVIEASLGSVTLASGQTSTLDFYGDGLVSLAVTSPVQALAIGPDGKPFTATIENNGKIAAQHVLVTASVVKEMVDNSINMSGVVEAKGVTVSGGDITLDGGDGDVTVAGTLDVTSQQAKGGAVAVTGGTVTLASTAKIDASGATGGGTVQVGGGPHGSGSLKHATTVLVQGGSAILANALTEGDGGAVSVWSDGVTGFAGTIQAKGAGTGNGGWVETSGHYLSIAGGRVDTTAPLGKIGTWLLDPTDVDIENSSSITGNSGTTTYTQSSPIYDTDLNQALQTSNVFVQTDGNITVDVGALINWSASTKLTLDATYAGGSGNIALNGTIQAPDFGTLSLISSGTVTQGTGSILQIQNLELLGADGTYTLTSSNNQIRMLAANTGSLALYNGGRSDGTSQLDIGTITSVDVNSNPVTTTGLTLTGTLSLTGLDSSYPLTIDENVTVGSGGVDLRASTTHAQTIQIGNNLTIDTTGDNGAIQLSVLDGDGVSNRALTLLAGTGTITLSGAIGSVTPLASLSATGGSILLPTAVTTVGLQSYTGATTLDGTYSTTNSDFTVAGAGSLTAATTVSPGTGIVSFTSTIDGARALALTGAGAVTFGGVIGNSTSLASLTVTGSTISLPSAVTTTGLQHYTGTTTLDGIYATTNSAFTVTGAATLAAGTTVNTGSGAIGITSTINGAQALTLTSTGAVTLGGIVGGSIALASLTVSGGTISLPTAVTTTGLQHYTGTTTLDGTYSTTNSAFTVTGASSLTADTMVSSGSGAIGFTGTINGAQALTLNSSGAVTLGGVIGGATALTSLTVTGGTINLTSAITTTGLQHYTGTTTLDSTYTTTNSAFTVTGAAILGADATVNTGTGAINFTSTIDNTQFLTLSGGAVTLSGTIGNGGALSALMVTGSSISLSASITTTGMQHYTGPTTLGGTYTSSSNGAFTITGAATLTADTTIGIGTGALGLTGTVNGAFALGLTGGAVTLGGAIGGTTPLTSLTAAGSTISLPGAVTTTGLQQYTGAATLTAATTLSAGTGSIDFSSTIDGAETLMLSGGLIGLSGAIGGTTPLASLTVSGTTITLSSVTTSGVQNYTGSTGVSVGGTTYGTTNSDVTFTGPVTLINGNEVTFNAGSGTIHFLGTIDGDASAATEGLQLTAGTVTLDAAIGSGTAFTNLDVTGSTAITLASATTTGEQTYTGPVTVSGTTSINAGTAAVTFTSTIDGAAALTVSGSALTFGGAIGSGTALTSLTATGTTSVKLAGDVATTGDQTYTGAVLIDGAAVTLSDSGTSSTILFNNTIDGVTSNALTISAANGAVTFDDSIGATTALSSLSVTASGSQLITFADTTTTNVVTTGNQSYNSPVSFGLGTYILTSSGGDVHFAGTIGGSGGIVVSNAGGTVEFDQEFGTNIDSLDVTAATITLSSTVHTQTGQTYNGAVVVKTPNVVLTDNGTGVVFGSTIDGFDDSGTYDLDVEAPNGSIQFNGAIGATHALTNLTVAISNGGTITLGSVNTTGFQYFDGPVLMSGTVQLTAGDTVHFTSTIDGAADLTVNSTGAAEFDGDIGDTTALNSFTLTAPSATLPTIHAGSTNISLTDPVDLNGSVDYATFLSDVQYHTSVTLTGDTTISTSTGDMSFSQAFTGAFALALTDTATGSTVTLGGSLGTTVSPLTTLQVTAPNITLQGTVVTTSNQIYQGAITIGAGGASISALNTSVATINFDGAIDGNGNLGVSSDPALGLVTFVQSIGATTAIGNLSVSGSSISFGGAVVNAGSATLTGAVVINQDLAMTLGINGDFLLTGTLDSVSSTARSFQFTSTGNSGNATITGTVGGANKLSSLTLGGAHISVADVNTTGTQHYSSATTLNGNLTSDTGNINIDGAATLGNNAVIVTATGGSVTFGSTIDSIDSGQGLTVSAGTTVAFGGDVGGTTDLSSLLVTAPGGITLQSGATTVEAEGAVEFNGPVNLAATTTTITSIEDSITFDSTIDGTAAGKNLVVNAGNIVGLAGTVGGTTALASLTATGNTIDLDSVTTTGLQNYTGDIQFSGTLSAGGTITFDGVLTINTDSSISTSSGDILFEQQLHADGIALVLAATTGSVAIPNDLGGETPLVSLDVTGGTGITLPANITTDGHQTYTGPISVTGVTLTSNGGNIHFLNGIDGTGDLVVDAGSGTVVFGGNVGFPGEEINSVTVTGSTITLPATMFTSYTGTGQIYNGNLVLVTDTSLEGTEASVTINGNINGAFGLEIDGDFGSTITINGLIGNTTPLTNLRFTANTILNSVTTTGDQEYDRNVTLASNAVLTAQNGGVPSGTISFNSDVDATTAAGQSLTVSAAHVSFGFDVGDSQPLSSLTVTANTISLSSFITTDGAQAYTGAVTLNGDNSLFTNNASTGTIAFLTAASTIDAANAGQQGLDIFAASTVELDGAIGSVAPVRTLGVVASGLVGSLPTIQSGGLAIQLGNGPETLSGNVDYQVVSPDGALVLVGDTTIGSFNDMSFSNTIDGAYSLTLNDSGASITITGAIGGTTPLSGINVAAGHLDIEAPVTVTGNFTAQIGGGGSFTLGSGASITAAGVVNVAADSTVFGDDVDSTADGIAITIQGNITADGIYMKAADQTVIPPDNSGSITISGGGQLNATSTVASTDAGTANLILYTGIGGTLTIGGGFLNVASGNVALVYDHFNQTGTASISSSVSNAGQGYLILAPASADGSLTGGAGYNDFTAGAYTGSALMLDGLALGGTQATIGVGTATGTFTVTGFGLAGANLGTQVGLRNSTNSVTAETSGAFTLTKALRLYGDLTIDSEIDTSADLTLASTGDLTLGTPISATSGANVVLLSGHTLFISSNVSATGGGEVQAAFYHSADGGFALQEGASISSDKAVLINVIDTSGEIDISGAISAPEIYVLASTGAGTGSITLGETAQLINTTVAGSASLAPNVAYTILYAGVNGAIQTIAGSSISGGNANVALVADTLSIAAGSSISTDGRLIVSPASTDGDLIGGTLTLPGATQFGNFVTNFASPSGSVAAVGIGDGATGDFLLSSADIANLSGGIGSLGTFQIGLPGNSSTMNFAGNTVFETQTEFYAGTYNIANGATVQVAAGAPQPAGFVFNLDQAGSSNTASFAAGAGSTISAPGDILFSDNCDASGGTCSGTSSATFGGAVTAGQSFAYGQSGPDLISVLAGASITSNGFGGVSIGGAGLTLAGSLTANNGGMSIFAPVTLPSGAIGQMSATDGIDLLATIDGPGGLVATSSNSIVLAYAIGATAPLASLALTGSTISLADNITTTGNQTYSGAVLLDGDVVATATSGGAIRFAGTIDAGMPSQVGGFLQTDFVVSPPPPPSLAVTTNGSAEFDGAIGAQSPLDNFTLNAASVVGTLPSIYTTGTQTISVTAATQFGGTYSFQSFVDDQAMMLTGDTVIIATGGVIQISGQISGNHSLTLNDDGATISLTGGIDAANPLSALIINAGHGITLGGTIITTGAQTYSGPLSLASDVTLNAAGTITFGGTIDGAHGLTINDTAGSVVATAAIGNTAALASLTIDAATISLGSVATTGAQSYTGAATLGGTYSDSGFTASGPVQLSAATTITADTGGIDLAGTIDGAQTLALIDTNGTVSVTGGVGSQSALAALTLYAAAIDLGSVTTTGAQNYTGTTTLGGTYTGTGFTVAGATLLSGTTIVSAGTGGVSFEGTVGSTSALTSLTVTGAAITLGSTITTTGSQTYSGPLSLASDVILNAAGTVTFGGTVDGAHGLTVNDTAGSVVATAAIGNTIALANLTIDAATISLGSVATTGAQSYAGAATLGGTYSDSGFTASGPVQLSAATTITAGMGGIGLTGTINGAQTLVLVDANGTVSVTGGVGSQSPLAALTINAAAIDLGSITTSGTQSYSGTTTLGGTYAGAGFTVAGATLLSGTTVISAGTGGVSFDGTVDGAQSLALNDVTGAVTLAGTVGGKTALTSLTVNGAAITTQSVTTTGAQIYTGAMALDGTYTGGSFQSTGADQLTGATVVSANNGNVGFTGTIDGAQSLTLAATSGSVTVTGAVGGSTALSSLTLGGNADIVDFTGSVTTTQLTDMRTAGSLTLAGGLSTSKYTTSASNDVLISITGGTGPLSLAGEFDFATALDLSSRALTLTGMTVLDTSAGNGALTLGSVDGAYALTLNAGSAAVAFKGAVGATTALGGLTITGGTISLGNVHTTGAQVYNGAVTMGGMYIASSFTANGTDLLAGATGVTVTGGNIGFGSLSGTQALTLVDTTGIVSLGNVTGLANLTITASGIVGGSVISTVGSQTYSGPLTLASTSALTSTAGDLSFGGTINGTKSLTLSAGGNITFGGTLAASTNRTVLSILTANNVTVINNSSLWVDRFTATANSLEFGDHSLESDDVVTINASSVDGRVISSSATLNVNTATGIIQGDTVTIAATGAVTEQMTGGAILVRSASFDGAATATRSVDINSTGDVSGNIAVSGGTATVTGATVSGSVTSSGLAQISASEDVTANVLGGSVNINAGDSVTGSVTSTGGPIVIVAGNAVDSTIVAQNGGSISVTAGNSIRGSATGGNISLTAPLIDETVNVQTAVINSADATITGTIGGTDADIALNGGASNVTQAILGATQQVASNADGSSSDDGSDDDDDKKKKKKKAAEADATDQTPVYDFANQYIDKLVGGKQAH